MSGLKIITTTDGSHSLYHEGLNETYHSIHGALRESEHVFIKHGLDHFVRQSSATYLSVLEIGFGTGLNALLTLQYVMQTPVKVHYVSVEANPVPPEIWSVLNYPQSIGLGSYFNLLHEAAWEEEQQLHENFLLTKRRNRLQDIALPQDTFDLIYFDAFAPGKQPDMWTWDMLAKVVTSMKGEGIFTTYCAKGQVKRDLRSLNLTVETLPGPPGKKEMVRGRRLKN